MDNTVYHYTSPEGIFNILNSQTLWFTDSQYLNDMNESSYAIKPFLEAYNKVMKEEVDSEDAESLTQDDTYIKEIFDEPYESFSFDEDKEGRLRTYHHRFFVLCASVNDDSVNMWNYYVKNDKYQGYNIGINQDVLRQAMINYEPEKITLSMQRITYDYALQVEMFCEKFREISFTSYFGGHEYLYDILQDKLREVVDSQKIFIKNPAFSSENEYRFVLKVPDDFKGTEKLKLKYRVGNSGVITPYIEWDFSDWASNMFSQVTLAPSAENDLVVASFKRFLDKGVYGGISVKPSSIRLRY